MTKALKKPAVSLALYLMGVFMLATYFTFASVQGDFGLFRRIQIDAEAAALRLERDRLAEEVAEMTNLTGRLSDDYLDLDLLDQQARDVLGRVRSDEIVLHQGR